MKVIKENYYAKIIEASHPVHGTRYEVFDKNCNTTILYNAPMSMALRFMNDFTERKNAWGS